MKILVLDDRNSVRSQMAEGYLRVLLGSDAVVVSAGKYAFGVDPLAVKVMAEDGIDISRQVSKTIADALDAEEHSDCVITFSDAAVDHFPLPAGGVYHIHRYIDDVSGLSLSEDEKIERLRSIRNELKAFVSFFVQKPDYYLVKDFLQETVALPEFAR
jgi:arsenate reductase